MLADVRAYDEAMRRVEQDEAEFLPAERVERLIAGDSPIKVWREHRGLTQQALADAAGITKGYLSQLEAGNRAGTTRRLSRLAQALRIDADDLIGAEREK